MPCTADGGQRFTHLVKLERLDDGGNEFHGNVPIQSQKDFVIETTTLVFPAPSGSKSDVG